MRHVRSSISAVTLAVLAGCIARGDAIPGVASAVQPAAHAALPAARASAINWPQQGMNAAHTAFNASEKTIGTGNVANLAQLWSFPTGAQISAPILIEKGVAYVNSADGYLYAVNATTGAQIWKYQTYEGGGSQDDPAISGTRIFVGCLTGGNSQQNGICALKLSTGSLQWSYYYDCNCAPPSGLAAAPVVSGNTLLVPYRYGQNFGGPQLVALNAVSGKVLWSYSYPGGNSGGPSPSAPAVANSTVYLGEGYSNAVCSLQLSSGAFNWCAPTGDSNNSPAVAKGTLYVNTASHGVFAFNGATGTQLWQYTPTAGNYGGQDDPPAVAKGKVYVAGVGFSGNLYALNAANGALIFNTSVGSGNEAATTSSPSIANGVAYVECDSGVCAFDAKTGAQLYSAASSGSQQSSPAVVNGVVYDTCGPNTACAYALPAKH
jgi:outer membrane protein assembly factor BamB